MFNSEKENQSCIKMFATPWLLCSLLLLKKKKYLFGKHVPATAIVVASVDMQMVIILSCNSARKISNDNKSKLSNMT